MKTIEQNRYGRGQANTSQEIGIPVQEYIKIIIVSWHLWTIILRTQD